MQKNAEELYNIYLNIARNKYSYLLLRLEQITNYINSIKLGVGGWESQALETFQMINEIKNTFDSAVPRSNDPDFTPENTPVVADRNIPGELKMVLESLAVVDVDWLKCADFPLNIQGDVFSDRNPYELNIQTARNKYSYLLLRLEQITGYINGIKLGVGDFGSKVFEVFKMINKIKDTFDSVTPRNSDPDFTPENTPVVADRNIPGELKMVLDELEYFDSDSDWKSCRDLSIDSLGVTSNKTR